MKIDVLENDIILFLRLTDIKELNFERKKDVEAYFKNILLRLKEYYLIDISNFYNVYVYVDKNEGMILKLEKEELDYYHSFGSLEMRILKEENTFLYEINDIFSVPYKELDIYLYKNKFYVKRKNKKIVYPLYEFGKIIYEDTYKILNNGKKMTIG
jgi:hypothetical protein